MIPETLFSKEEPCRFKFDVGCLASERFGHLLSRIHVDAPQKQFAIGFPEYSESSLGRELRLFTETRQDALDILRGQETSCYILGNLAITPPEEIPVESLGKVELFVRRRSDNDKHSLSAISRKEKRTGRSHNFKIEQEGTCTKIQFGNNKKVLPNLFIQSRSTRQSFCVYVEKIQIIGNYPGLFIPGNAYGLGGVTPVL
jgi:CRISPR-associated endoribonuclease Cas6/Csy4 subtype I-F